MSRQFSVIDVPQRSEAWFAARAGVVTASGAASMFTKARKGADESVMRRNLRVRLALELLTGKPGEEADYVSGAMQRGVDREAESFGAYESATGSMVQRVGFLRHATLPAGCSPDGIVGDFEGGLELKNPIQATHWDYLQLGGTVPQEYVTQVTHSLFVTGLPWWDFVSYHPEFPESGRLYRVRTRREDVDLTAYALVFDLFWSEVEKEVNKMRERLLVAEVA